MVARHTGKIIVAVSHADPIKAATLKLPYSDERVIHFGLIPRAHRGIFVINELPDLQARIQVSLFINADIEQVDFGIRQIALERSGMIARPSAQLSGFYDLEQIEVGHCAESARRHLCRQLIPVEVF